MQRSQSHNFLDLGAHQGAAKHGHRALAVDHRSYAQFFVYVSGSAKPAHFSRWLCSCDGASEEFPRTEQCARQCAEATEKRTAFPFFAEDHGYAPFFAAATTAAVQLISTSESPGSAGTATVVRAGPPCGKYVLKTW